MGKEQRALAITLLMVLAIVLATGFHRDRLHDDETVLAALAADDPGVVAMVSPRRLSIARAPDPGAEAGDLAASRLTAPAEQSAEQSGAVVPTPTSRKTGVPETAMVTASREPAPATPAVREPPPPANVVEAAWPEPPVPASPARENQASVGGDDEGRLPGIVIDSRGVDLDRYLRLVESMGALFLLTNDNRLGLRVSLLRGMTIPGGIPGALVRERPHVVADPRFLQRLDTVPLPADVRRDRLVLLLTRRADRMLWRGVADALSRRGLAQSSVALISGAYVETGRRISIRFDTATLRDGRGTVRLSEPGRRGAS